MFRVTSVQENIKLQLRPIKKEMEILRNLPSRTRNMLRRKDLIGAIIINKHFPNL